MSSSKIKRAAIITGAGRRVGRSIALAMARSGWDIGVHYHRSQDEAHATADEIRALGANAVPLYCDLSDEAAVLGLLPQAQLALGRVTCVVNSASVFEYDCAADFSHAVLDRHMRVNLTAPILLARALYEATGDGPPSVVVNLLDQKLYNLNPDFLSYTMSKAALHTATTTLAQALAPRVRVVGVAPGLTLISHLQSEQAFADAHRISPLGESSHPEEVADAVVFAAQSRAITGSTIVVDAGQHLIPLERDFSFFHRK